MGSIVHVTQLGSEIWICNVNKTEKKKKIKQKYYLLWISGVTMFGLSELVGETDTCRAYDWYEIELKFSKRFNVLSVSKIISVS